MAAEASTRFWMLTGRLDSVQEYDLVCMTINDLDVEFVVSGYLPAPSGCLMVAYLQMRSGWTQSNLARGLGVTGAECMPMMCMMDRQILNNLPMNQQTEVRYLMNAVERMRRSLGWRSVTTRVTPYPLMVRVRQRVTDMVAHHVQRLFPHIWRLLRFIRRRNQRFAFLRLLTRGREEEPRRRVDWNNTIRSLWSQETIVDAAWSPAGRPDVDISALEALMEEQDPLELIDLI